jgi:hypothetical protein
LIPDYKTTQLLRSPHAQSLTKPDLTTILLTSSTATIDNMVMTDFFNLSDAEYALRIQDYSSEKLLSQLKVKNMQVKVGEVIAQSSTVTSGVAGVVLGHTEYIPVLCGSISRIGKRRVVVSEQKIRLMEAELERRGNSTADIQEAAEGPPTCEKLPVCDGDSPETRVVVEDSPKESMFMKDSSS